MDKAAAADAIITAALPHVAFDGWTQATLARAAIDAGYKPEELVRIFPAGIKDALGAFARWVDSQMLAAYAALPSPPQKVRERITALIWQRLMVLAPHREAMRRTVAHYALPLYAGQGMAALSRTVSEMWYAAGDITTDFNWYTKRFLLAGVYSSTLLYWLSDESEAYANTRAFLERRIADVMQIERLKQQVRAFGFGKQ